MARDEQASSRTPGRAAGASPPMRRIVKTDEFRVWWRELDTDTRERVEAAARRVVSGGPTLGRPRVDVIHGTQTRKLKELRVGRATRVLFAFDSNRNVVMLAGGDKTGRWNRWYPGKIQQAERLYLEHERSIGKEGRCPNGRNSGRSPGMSR